jgi:chemotaxis protein MotB
MARRKKEEEHVNHERWLVSYADFITLLFAFFVVLFAVSQVDQKKMGRFTEAVQDATQIGIFDGKQGPAPIVGGGASGVPTAQEQLAPVVPSGVPGTHASLDVIRERLHTNLAKAIGAGRVTLVERGDGLVVRLRDAAFFEPAKAIVRREVLDDLSGVGRTLRELENEVRVEGHTDPIPIHNSLYRSNWELSAARAAAVLDQLVQNSGIHESRLSVAGYASQRPIADNDTVEGRSQNRRVDIIVLDRGRVQPSPERAPTVGGAQ